MARTSVRQLAGLPTVQAGLTRLAAAKLRKAGLRLEPLLSRTGVTREQLDDPEQRISAQAQIAFLEAAAEEIGDDTLGLTLAREFEPQDLGLLYYVLASSQTLGDALKRGARYSQITNEAVVFDYREAREPYQQLSYAGIPRHADRHQMEFCVLGVVRLYRLLTGRNIVPRRVSMVHVRTRSTAEYARFLGTEVKFGADHDEIVFPEGAADLPLVEADPRLSKILMKVAEDTLNAGRSNVSDLRVSVENAITPLLPHGSARAETVAAKLGMSERTLARRLAEEGTNFHEVLQQLRASLAVRYLEDENMPISKIAWLLGFEEPSSFSHACRRWTGKSPRELRLADVIAAG
jgi:AraC-like DNA-binding protein/transcriptional regulator with XRE-family HTH domain